jgi:hypothetical protein
VLKVRHFEGAGSLRNAAEVVEPDHMAASFIGESLPTHSCLSNH